MSSLIYISAHVGWWSISGESCGEGKRSSNRSDVTSGRVNHRSDQYLESIFNGEVVDGFVASDTWGLFIRGNPPIRQRLHQGGNLEDKTPIIFSTPHRRHRCPTNVQQTYRPSNSHRYSSPYKPVVTWCKPNEKPPKLTLDQALQITLIYHRHNLTEDLLAHFFGISQPNSS